MPLDSVMRSASPPFLHHDHRLLLVERDVGEAAAVRRPRRRHDRLVGGEHRLRIEAVGIGDLQLVAPPALHHIGDLGREDALVAGEALVDHVGDAMRGRAQLRRRHDVRIARELALLLHVEEPEAHLDASLGDVLDLADHQGLGAARGPVGEVHLGGLGGQRRHPARIDDAEEPGATEVRGDHVAYRLGLRAVPCHRHDGDRHLAAAARRDVDGELRARAQREQQESEEKDDSRGWPFRSRCRRWGCRCAS